MRNKALVCVFHGVFVGFENSPKSIGNLILSKIFIVVIYGYATKKPY